MHIAVVGLGFGADFVPIYRAHPLVSHVTICDPNPEATNRVTEENPGVSVASFNAILANRPSTPFIS